MNKEQVYDGQISPLVDQIIEICEKHKIGMLLSFAIPTDDDPSLAVTSTLLTDEYEPYKEQRDAVNMLMQRSRSVMATTKDADEGAASPVTTLQLARAVALDELALSFQQGVLGKEQYLKLRASIDALGRG